MKLTIEQTEKILKSNQPFKQFAFAMMITRLRGKYAKDSSKESVKSCMDEINSFIDKFSSIISDDYKIAQNI